MVADEEVNIHLLSSFYVHKSTCQFCNCLKVIFLFFGVTIIKICVFLLAKCALDAFNNQVRTVLRFFMFLGADVELILTSLLFLCVYYLVG